jgi:hypothetical protein
MIPTFIRFLTQHALPGTEQFGQASMPFAASIVRAKKCPVSIIETGRFVCESVSAGCFKHPLEDDLERSLKDSGVDGGA